MNAYNTALRRYVLNYKSSYVKYTHVVDCLAGSRGGFLSDDNYYNNATPKKIITKFKRWHNNKAHTAILLYVPINFALFFTLSLVSSMVIFFAFLTRIAKMFL